MDGKPTDAPAVSDLQLHNLDISLLKTMVPGHTQESGEYLLEQLMYKDYNACKNLSCMWKEQAAFWPLCSPHFNVQPRTVRITSSNIIINEIQTALSSG